MRYFRYAFLAAVGIILISVSLANRGMVTLRLVPEGLEGLVGVNYSLSLPLFVVILGGVAAGLIIGFVWEWLREMRHRREASTKGREVRKLEREVDKLKTEKHAEKDEVLAILDKAS